MNLTLLNLEKRHYLPHFLSNKCFKGTVVNRALQIVRERSHEITRTVPLNLKIFRQEKRMILTHIKI